MGNKRMTFEKIKADWEELGENPPEAMEWLINEVEILSAENRMFAEFITQLSDMIISTGERMARLPKNE
jgi:hypothetical protein